MITYPKKLGQNYRKKIIVYIKAFFFKNGRSSARSFPWFDQNHKRAIFMWSWRNLDRAHILRLCEWFFRPIHCSVGQHVIGFVNGKTNFESWFWLVCTSTQSTDTKSFWFWLVRNWRCKICFNIYGKNKLNFKNSMGLI